jgi:hypothetical protein
MAVPGELLEEQDLVMFDGRGDESAGDDQLLLWRLTCRLLLERLVGLLDRTLRERKRYPCKTRVLSWMMTRAVSRAQDGRPTLTYCSSMLHSFSESCVDRNERMTMAVPRAPCPTLSGAKAAW